MRARYGFVHVFTLGVIVVTDGECVNRVVHLLFYNSDCRIFGKKKKVLSGHLVQCWDLLHHLSTKSANGG